MNPWLRELVHTLAAMAVEDARAREVGDQGAVVHSGGRPLTWTAAHGNVVGRATVEAPAEHRAQVPKPRTQE